MGGSLQPSGGLKVTHLGGILTKCGCSLLPGGNLQPSRRVKNNKILLPSAVHLEERLTVSQSVSQSGNKSARQSVRQAGRQTKKHSLGFFQWQTQLSTAGKGIAVATSDGPMVMQSTANTQVCGRIPVGRPPAVLPDLSTLPNLTLVQTLLSTHKLLIPPHPPPPPKKSDIQFQGIEASESKNPLGDRLIGQNNDFTRGWTSNIMPWGMLREWTPKRGGYTTPAPALDLTTSLRGDLG